MNTTISALSEIVATADDCKRAYFWAPGGNAAARRLNEHRRNKPEIAWTEGGHAYTARFDYSESCHHVYASGHYTRDGQKTTLTAIRNSLKRMEAANDTSAN